MNRPQTNLLFAVIASLVTLGLLTLAGRTEESRMQHREQALHAQAIEVGAELYVEHCRTCHGVNGEGVGQLGPALNDQAFFEDRIDEVGWQGTLEEYVVHSTAVGRVIATRPWYHRERMEERPDSPPSDKSRVVDRTASNRYTYLQKGNCVVGVPSKDRCLSPKGHQART